MNPGKHLPRLLPCMREGALEGGGCQFGAGESTVDAGGRGVGEVGRGITKVSESKCLLISWLPSPSAVILELARQEHWSGLPFPSPMHESEK